MYSLADDRTPTQNTLLKKWKFIHSYSCYGQEGTSGSAGGTRRRSPSGPGGGSVSPRPHGLSTVGGGRREKAEGGIPPIRAEVLSENENMGTGRQEQPTPMQPIYHFKGRENSKKK